MSRKLISKLTTLLNDGENKDQIKVFEEMIVDEIEEYVEQKHFFQLPTNEILKIIDKSDIENIDLIAQLLHK